MGAYCTAWGIALTVTGASWSTGLLAIAIGLGIIAVAFGVRYLAISVLDMGKAEARALEKKLEKALEKPTDETVS